MKTKVFIFISIIVVVALFGFRVEARDEKERNLKVLQASDLQPAASKKAKSSFVMPASVTYYSPTVIENTLTVNKTAYFPVGMHVGKTTGEGGVIFLNGTISNASAGNEPVTIGDDLRIEGRLYRKTGGRLAPVQIRSGLFIQGNVYGHKDLITFDDQVKIKSGRKLTLTGVTIEGLSVSNSQIAADAITTDKIKDGTIIGSDVSSSTDINIVNLELTGNATQTTSKYGIVKAAAYVNSSGGVIRSWSTGSQEAISITHTPGSGLYQLNFHWDVSSRYFQVSPVNTSNINVTANFNSNSQIIDVYTWTSGGAATDSGFIITLY